MRFLKVTVHYLNFFKKSYLKSRYVALRTAQHTDTNNDFATVRAQIVECHRSFDNFAVFRVQFVGYRWFIRQFPKIREPVVSKFPYSPDLFDILALIGAGITEYRLTVRFLGPTIIYLFTKSLGICANTIEPN